MTCPTCGGELEPGADRCPVCERPSAPRVEGALAADPRLVTPPARGKARLDVLHDAPVGGKREARERSWRDEVRERVRSRRQKRVEAGLPLFDEPQTTTQPAPAAEAVPAAPTVAAAREQPREQPHLILPELSEVELADLPLHAGAPNGRSEADVARRRHGREPARTERQGALPPSLDDEELLETIGDEPEIEPRLAPPPAESPSLEKPARPGERAQAAAFDAALFAIVAAIVVYFTGRTARVGLEALLPAWPWLVAYQGLLAAFYAGYFTGTTGQTPGKLITGLRVVDTTGRPPGCLRAAGRAGMGLIGIALGGLGLLPMAFDPALRTAHDRLFQTRVVRF